MPLYEYETVPAAPCESATRFTWRQHFDELPLELHPDTGAAVRRVISGGLGALLRSRSGSAVTSALVAEQQAAFAAGQQPGGSATGSCGPSCGCVG